MTPTATYLASENCLKEESWVEKPERDYDDYDPYSEHWNYWVGEWREYKNHLATLRKIPCDPSCKGLWADQQEVVEGKDYEVREPEVDIHAPSGTKIRANFVNGIIVGGYDHHKAKAMQHLKPDTIYEIESTFISGWHTDFYLKEIPGVAFNSVHFVYPEPTAFPLVPVKSEEDLWEDVEQYLRSKTDYTRWFCAEIVNELKSKYSLIKR